MSLSNIDREYNKRVENSFYSEEWGKLLETNRYKDALKIHLENSDSYFFNIFIDKYCGYIVAHIDNDTCIIDDFYLLESYRGLHVGSSSLYNLLTWPEIRERNIYKYRVAVSNSNETAIRLFKHFKFAKTNSSSSSVIFDKDSTKINISDFRKYLDYETALVKRMQRKKEPKYIFDEQTLIEESSPKEIKGRQWWRSFAAIFLDKNDKALKILLFKIGDGKKCFDCFRKNFPKEFSETTHFCLDKITMDPMDAPYQLSAIETEFGIQTYSIDYDFKEQEDIHQSAENIKSAINEMGMESFINLLMEEEKKIK